MKSVFFSYSHKDEAIRDQLETHLAMLKRQGVISTCDDRRLIAGDNIDNGIARELEQADIILLVVSPNFLASDYCYGVEVARALERHAAGEARVYVTAFGKLLAAPTDGRPVTKWTDPDDAFLDIAKAIRAAVGTEDRATDSVNAPKRPAALASSGAGPRSSNLCMHKTFTELVIVSLMRPSTSWPASPRTRSMSWKPASWDRNRLQTHRCKTV